MERVFVVLSCLCGVCVADVVSVKRRGSVGRHLNLLVAKLVAEPRCFHSFHSSPHIHTGQAT